jgi:hypothetical protein
MPSTMCVKASRLRFNTRRGTRRCEQLVCAFEWKQCNRHQLYRLTHTTVHARHRPYQVTSFFYDPRAWNGKSLSVIVFQRTYLTIWKFRSSTPAMKNIKWFPVKTYKFFREIEHHMMVGPPLLPTRSTHNALSSIANLCIKSQERSYRAAARQA